MTRTQMRLSPQKNALFAAAFLAVLTLLAPPADLAAQTQDEAISHAKSLSRAFRNAAQATRPTVVKIRTRTTAREISRNSDNNPFEGTPFEDFFDDDALDRFRSRPQSGLGSGVIIDAGGTILTNNHVVGGADEVYVKLSDGREFRATDVRTDESTDLAVIQIQSDSPLPAARLGDSDALEIGDWVIAIGNPFDQELTVTAGIISGKGRSLGAARRAEFLQTDAAINPGNSGGPLINLDGEVVGINTAIASNSGGYQGIGFSVPVNLAKWVTGELVEHGSVRRAYLGVGIRPLDAQFADAFGVDLTRTQGVLITAVFEGSPAAAAGFQEGDVVTAFANTKVRTPSELQKVVERVPFGSMQRVDVIRDGSQTSLQVRIEAMPEDFGSTAQVPSRPGSSSDEEPDTYEFSDAGLTVAELTPQLAEQLGFENQRGVVVMETDAGSIADNAGLRPGMLIATVGRDRQRVDSLDSFREAISGESLDSGILLLIRDVRGAQDFVILERE